MRYQDAISESYDTEARERGYISEVSFLVDKKLNKQDYVEVWPDSGWYRLIKLRVVR